MKILFVLKERQYSSNSNSYGLINSARHVARYLRDLGHVCEIVQVIDGNFIDAALYKHKPDLVVIEALWVSGSKMEELMNIPRYANITWVVRVHSDIGFLSAETLALKYINDYIALNRPNLLISMNNESFNFYLSSALSHNFIYLPNIISSSPRTPSHFHKHKNYINVGCFGSLRLLKNHGYQALCAMEMANRLNKKLRFHISVDVGMSESSNRYPILTNLEQLFVHSPHELVKHEWKDNEAFLDLIATMDIGMQLSYTESFNIVSADFVRVGIPIVVSPTISWMPWIFKTSTTDYEKSINKLMFIYKHRNSKFLRAWMRSSLEDFNAMAKTEWADFLSPDF